MKKLFFIIIASNLLLISCNSFRESAGVNRKIIDEYQVIENPPLIIPPNFDLLPPDQIEAKNIENTDSELAKEILFGLDDFKNENESNNTLIAQIIKETNSDNVDQNIRESINKDFAGEKSTKNDETIFKNEDDIKAAIKNTEYKDKNNDNKKKKKKFFFF
tara:strand:- start:146 stop:628 length:483 start_codon:yes stop_codon:yes gene_type:complete